MFIFDRWITFVEQAQNGTADQAGEAYQKFLLSLTDLELLVRSVLKQWKLR